MRTDVMRKVVEPCPKGQLKDVRVPLYRCHLHSGCSVTESPGGVGVGSEDHVLGSERAMCDMSAEHGALL